MNTTTIPFAQQRTTLRVYTGKEKPEAANAGYKIIAKAQGVDKTYHPNLKATLWFQAPVFGDEEIVENIDSLVPHLRSMLDDARKEVAKAIRLDSGAESIALPELTIGCAIRYLNEQSTGARITLEYVNSWFAEYYEHMAHEFANAAICKFPTPWNATQFEVVKQKANLVRGVFGNFASKNYMPNEKHRELIRKFAKFCRPENCDSRMSQFLAKCDDAERVENATFDAFELNDDVSFSGTLSNQATQSTTNSTALV